MDFLAFINSIPNFSQYSRKNKILLIAFYLREYKALFEFSMKDINVQCIGTIRPPSKLKDCILELSKGRNATIIHGANRGSFCLSKFGIDEVQKFLSDGIRSNEYNTEFAKSALTYLNKILTRVTEYNKRNFLEEAISCLAVNSRRAAVLMTWECVIDHLYDYTLKHKETEFNIESKKVNAKWKIVSKDDFTNIKENKFIEILRAAGIITNDVRKILDEKIGIRNSAAHPSNIEIHTSKVVNFIEDLIDNVILKYKI
jgi:hypothetical protein